MGYYQLQIIELSQRREKLYDIIAGLEADGLPHDPHSFGHFRRYESASYSYQTWSNEPDWFAEDMLYIELIMEFEEIPNLLEKYQSVISDITRSSG